ncbi:hypothetical protein M427DRAFT_33107 [Gonapodya prolifera JEL478]|uniref:Uncharacterized protein n=1 Tax=Gonapodya prolifera (strain JEL478) TaxID=1344416 RepID=A0A139ACV4_GONPJ|nr:hypothetical protein M427DRAFT_33107 [Gonapodya prolifera JEL478]|eukprot:KXS14414.1 hypothetical protein M427DRAFT_33107 [Gonapodya prolifera JEL478]
MPDACPTPSNAVATSSRPNTTGAAQQARAQPAAALDDTTPTFTEPSQSPALTNAPSYTTRDRSLRRLSPRLPRPAPSRARPSHTSSGAPFTYRLRGESALPPVAAHVRSERTVLGSIVVEQSPGSISSGSAGSGTVVLDVRAKFGRVDGRAAFGFQCGVCGGVSWVQRTGDRERA